MAKIRPRPCGSGLGIENFLGRLIVAEYKLCEKFLFLQNIADIAGTGHYYVTPEMCRELKHIDNGVNHIRLDHDILKTERWNRLCNPSTTYIHKQGMLCLLSNTLLTIKEHATY